MLFVSYKLKASAVPRIEMRQLFHFFILLNEEIDILGGNRVGLDVLLRDGGEYFLDERLSASEDVPFFAFGDSVPQHQVNLEILFIISLLAVPYSLGECLKK